MWYLLYIPTNWKSPCRHFLPRGATQRILILGGSAPRSNPLLNFYTISFLTRKGPLSLTLSRNMLLYSCPIVVSLPAVFWMSRLLQRALCDVQKTATRETRAIVTKSKNFSVYKSHNGSWCLLTLFVFHFRKRYFLYTTSFTHLLLVGGLLVK